MQSAGKLTRKQEALMSALLTAPSLAAAAQHAGLSEVIAWRWLKDATLQANYRDARRALVQHAIAQVQRATGEAVETLRSVMQDAEAPASARVSAAKAISGPPSQASQWRTWQPALPPSTRKDRADAPAAGEGPGDPAGSPAACAAFQDTPLETTNARQWAAGLRVTCPHFFGQTTPARSAAPAASTVRARQPPQVPMPPD